jgi:hypothetical protein
MQIKLKSLIILFFTIAIANVYGQELDFTVVFRNQVRSEKASNFKIDPKLYREMESSIKDFFALTKWTENEYKPDEKIKGTFTVTILEELSPTRFTAEFALQTSRPIFNSTYESPALNFLEKDVTFDFNLAQAIQRSDKTYIDNLSSTLTFYALLALGFDHDSFELYGGENYFLAARDVFENLPTNLKRDDPNWTNQGTNGRSKYFLIDNIMKPRMKNFRQIYYEYHRLALDNMWEDAEKQRAVLLSTLGVIEDLNQAMPNSYILQVFNDTKYKELVDIFKAGDSGQKTKLRNIMTLTSLSNSGRFDELK